MTDRLRIALAQLDPVLGDIDGNLARLADLRANLAAAPEAPDLIVTTEMMVTGYPPEDLILKPFFLDRVKAAVADFAAATADGGPALLLGTPWRAKGARHNAALLIEGGEIRARRFKHELPNYGVFDEMRIFQPGPLSGPVEFRGVALGVMICEDMWTSTVAETLAETGAEMLIVLNASPFQLDKPDERLQLAAARVTETGLPLAYVNQIGGQDELTFDGGSFVLAADRSWAARLPEWEESVAVTDWRRGPAGAWNCAPRPLARRPGETERIYRAMMCGLADYVAKNGFPGVIIGLSGGIDSALTAVICADALGPERVRCVMMPSPHTSEMSLADSRELAARLEVRLESIDIGPAMTAFDEMLAPVLGHVPQGVTAENIQPRARSICLMALSNDSGALLVTTGNKSEVSVGYATLYGDLSGGYSVLKDAYKTTVYRLARWRNRGRPDGARGPAAAPIPDNIIARPPSAELAADQKDSDSLPPYERLDDILLCLIEKEMGLDAIAARGHDPGEVARIWRMLDRAEYKRRQAPPGVKISSRAFGRDRRYPITNRFSHLIEG